MLVTCQKIVFNLLQTILFGLDNYTFVLIIQLPYTVILCRSIRLRPNAFDKAKTRLTELEIELRSLFSSKLIVHNK